jgi:hypothetical protein
MAVSLSAFAAKGAVYQAPAAEPEMARWTITGGATYLQPSLNGLDYLGVTQNDGEADESGTTYRVEPGYDFGYFLGFGYMINDHYDVQASWAQFDSESSDSTFVSGAPNDVRVSTSSFNDQLLDNDDTFNARAHETLNFQVFDATLGQYHKLGDNLMTRVFAGVRYAKIDNTSTNDYSYNDNGTINTGFDRYESTFSGVGPEVGLDMNYAVYDWFGIVGHFAGAFLVGSQDTDSNVLQGDYEDGFQRQSLVNGDNGTIMVPAIDAKLGVNLGVPFMDMQDRFMIEAGYQVAYYFNSVDQLQRDNDDNFVHNVSDVGMMGPYLNMGFKF